MSMLIINCSDRERWNDYVASQPGASLYQSYEWGQIRRSQGWEPTYLGVEEHGRCVGAALILCRRLPGGFGSILYSPRGPLAHSKTILTTLMTGVQDLAVERNAIFWRVEPPALADNTTAAMAFQDLGFRRLPEEWSYWNRPKYDMHVSISDGEAEVLKRISSRTRGKIRYAPKRGVVVEPGHGDRDLETFYRLLMNTGAKKHIPVREVNYFKELYWTLAKTGMGQLFMAKKDGGAIAAGMSSRFGRMASLLYLSNDYTIKYTGWAVQWEMVRWAIGEGCTVYDFAGTGTTYPPKETDKGYGVYQFKKSFGADIVCWYGYADYIFKPALYAGLRAIERSLPLGERIFLDLPKELMYRLRRKPPVETEGEKDAA